MVKRWCYDCGNNVKDCEEVEEMGKDKAGLVIARDVEVLENEGRKGMGNGVVWF